MSQVQVMWNAAIDTRRHALFEQQHGKRWETKAKPGSLHPFKRANELFQQVTDIYAQFSSQPHLVQEKLHELPPYVSRGHGWKGRIKNRTITGRWNQDRSKYVPHVGKKELAKAAYRALPIHMRNEVDVVAQQIMEEGL